MQVLTPLRVTYNQACELLSIKRNALANLIKNDSTFPKAYKYGTTRQAPVYFDYADLVAWHNNQKANAIAEA